ncbi:MAG: hypothetical protein K0S44_223 [Bacteroidetes bacterium]|jgi:hypothetical protein|nr:hypothetical protein [Bacteroidota bacterium]
MASEKRNPEIRIENVNRELHDDLMFIAKKINGVGLGSFLKPKLREIRDSYSAEIKRLKALPPEE